MKYLLDANGHGYQSGDAIARNRRQATRRVVGSLVVHRAAVGAQRVAVSGRMIGVSWTRTHAPNRADVWLWRGCCNRVPRKRRRQARESKRGLVKVPRFARGLLDRVGLKPETIDHVGQLGGQLQTGLFDNPFGPKVGFAREISRSRRCGLHFIKTRSRARVGQSFCGGCVPAGVAGRSAEESLNRWSRTADSPFKRLGPNSNACFFAGVPELAVECRERDFCAD